jgi:toluene monooxygenase electron transfer component
MGLYAVTVQPHGLTFRVREGEPILAAARRQGVWLPFECGWGSCGSCKVTLVAGEVRSLFPEAPAIKPRDVRRKRILTCQSTPRSDLVLRVLGELQPRDDLPTADYRGVLAEVKRLAPDIRRFRFVLDRPARYRAGQYAILELAPGLRRAYSMANLPGEAVVDFIVKRYPGGRGSAQLFALTPGAEIAMELPYGAAYLRRTARATAFAAGGTGIAPILALLRDGAASGAITDRPVYVFYGARTPEELVCLDELYALVTALPQAELIPVVEGTPDGWSGETGFVTDALQRRLPTPWTDYTFYMAGPPPMIQAMLRLLQEVKVPITQVYYDSFG